MSQDAFDQAVDAEWSRSARRGIAWTIVGAAIGALILGLLGLYWSQSMGAGALVGGIAVGAVLGGGFAWLLARDRAARAAHLALAHQWARANGWLFTERPTVPDIDLAFLRQGDRRYCEDGGVGMIDARPARFANFTIETDHNDANGDQQTNYEAWFFIVISRPWQGPELTLLRRSVRRGRAMRDALKTAATSRQVVDVENDAFAAEFQVTIPDAWDRDVVFLLIPPDMQEHLAEGQRLEGVRQVHSHPDFIFLAWRKHFSAKDLPLLERRLADSEWLYRRWGDVPLAMRPPAHGESG